jgi:hypothetical protein
MFYSTIISFERNTSSIGGPLLCFDFLVLHTSLKNFVQSIKTKLSKFDPFLFNFKNEATSIGDYFLYLIAFLVTFVQPIELNSFDRSTKQNILML